MHVQRVHTQVISSEIHALEHLPQRLLAALLHMHDLLQVSLHCPFDEAQQVLLVHAGRGMDVCVHLGQDRMGGAAGFPGDWEGPGLGQWDERGTFHKGGWAGAQGRMQEGGPTFRML